MYHYIFGTVATNEARRAEVGSNYPAVNEADVSQFKILLPPLPEQQQIAHILDTLDEAIRQTEHIIGKLKHIKQGLLHDLLTRGIDENGELRDPERYPEQFKESPVGLVPKAWAVEIGKNLFTLHSGTTPTMLRSDDQGRYLYIKVDDLNHPDNAYGIHTASLSFDDSISNRNAATSAFEPGVIVFPKRGAAIFLNRVRLLAHRANIDPNLMALQPREIIGSFLVAYLLYFNLSTICDNSGLPQLNNKHIYPMLFPRPSEMEQLAIVERLSALDDRIRVEQNEFTKLRLIKQGLMEDLLTGRVRVTNLEAAA